MLRVNCVVHSRRLILGSNLERLASGRNVVCRQQPYLQVQVRYLSVKDVFGRVDLDKVPDLPDAPLPPIPKPSVEELAAAGNSVLEELGLFSWFKPTGYIRWALEWLHISGGLPWWGAIVTLTFILRIAFIKVAIMSQKMVAVQNNHKTEMDDFRRRIDEARQEGNNMLIQQVLVEQRDFLRSKGIKMGRQAMVLVANGTIFLSNFMAIRGMTNNNYPGLENGGALWFTNLIETDPYYALPVISALTLAATMKMGTEFGATSDQLKPGMRLALQYGLPLVVLISSTQFASALGVYWCASNLITLSINGLFLLKPVRNFLGIPLMVRHEKKPSNPFRSFWSEYKNRKKAAPSISALRKKDAEQFKKAGTGKPII